MFEYPGDTGTARVADEFGLDDTWERDFGGTDMYAQQVS